MAGRDTAAEESVIRVRELTLDARVGVHARERDGPQPIVLDIRVGTRRAALAAATERIRDTIDYERIARRARRVVARRHYPLVETLAERIAEAVLGLRGAAWVEVRLEKLGCLDGAAAAGVEIRRVRPAGKPLAPIAPGEARAPEEIVVIGGGVAGASAALWCWRLGHPALLIDPGPALGGQLHLVNLPMIDLPGMPPLDGAALADRLARQLAGVRQRWLRAEVRGIDRGASAFRVRLAGGDEVAARAVIVATGLRRRRLGVPGERALAGRGILASGSRDPGALAGKRVAVVGSGDAACENAVLLARAGARVYLLHRRARLSARRELARAVAAAPGVERLPETRVLAFDGAEALEAVVVEGPRGRRRLPVDAALVRIGWEPANDLLAAHLRDARGFARADGDGRVRGEPGLYVAGDLLGRASLSVASAAGSGANAARAACDRLEAAANATAPPATRRR